MLVVLKGVIDFRNKNWFKKGMERKAGSEGVLVLLQ
jgi:hypothetical protein